MCKIRKEWKVFMNILDIIAKKRDKQELTKEEIEFFINGYTNGNITDYQAAALIMAIYINGMNSRETTDMTIAMTNSGETLDLSSISNIVVDKHSTGGVGDKITIILVPIIASLGIPVAKMSGRGLGFTGGTIDKLESIPGYNASLELKEFVDNVKKIGISVIGQTMNLAPADKKIYALRDTISCVDSMPLIASSIMSKKIAAGANKLVLEVTCGNGAFMKNREDAIKLANEMKEIGKLANKETVCVLTNMNEPIGKTVGNTLEIIEAIDALKGNMSEDVEIIITTVGAYIIKLSGNGDNIEENKLKIMENIKNGKAYNKFIEWISSQGGDISYVENIEKFEKARYVIPVISKCDGYVSKLNALDVGKISVNLGAGRMKKEDGIDNSVGIVLNKKISDKVSIGDTLAYIHANDDKKGKNAVEDLYKAYEFSENKPEKQKRRLGIV